MTHEKDQPIWYGANITHEEPYVPAQPDTKYVALGDGFVVPQGLLTWEGAGAIQAAMAGLGWSLTLHARPSSTSYAKPYFAGFYRLEDVGEGRADAGPDAIVLAACAALGVTG